MHSVDPEEVGTGTPHLESQWIVDQRVSSALQAQTVPSSQARRGLLSNTSGLDPAQSSGSLVITAEQAPHDDLLLGSIGIEAPARAWASSMAVNSLGSCRCGWGYRWTTSKSSFSQNVMPAEPVIS